MNRKKRTKLTMPVLLTYTCMITWLVFTMFPFVWLVMNSFKSKNEVLQSSWTLPQSLNLENYKILFQSSEFLIYFKNSVIVTSIALIILIVVASMTSFAISRFHYKWLSILATIFMFGLMIPVHTTILPLFNLMKTLHLIDNFFALPLPYVAFAIPQAVFLLTEFMKDIPREIEEAATIDGCSMFGLYKTIIMPLAKPGIVTICIFNGLFFWNEYLFPMLFTSSVEQRTISVGMFQFISSRGSNYGAWLAAVVISLLPTVIFYSFLNDKVVQGMTAGAIKG